MAQRANYPLSVSELDQATAFREVFTNWQIVHIVATILQINLIDAVIKNVSLKILLHFPVYDIAG